MRSVSSKYISQLSYVPLLFEHEQLSKCTQVYIFLKLGLVDSIVFEGFRAFWKWDLAGIRRVVEVGLHG